MFNSLFHPSISVIELLIRVVATYVFLLVLLRLSGKRELGQFSAIEFVSIMLISNAVQNSMNGGDNSLAGGLILAFGLIVMSSGVAYFSYRSRRFRRWVEGMPTLVIRHGKVIESALKKELITHEELITMCRKQGIHRLYEIDSAIFESDGRLTLTTVEQAEMMRKQREVPDQSEN